jgi:DNA-directed RNA polymerase beta' subunit
MRGMFVDQFVVIPSKYRSRNSSNKNCKFTTCITAIIKICKEYDGSNNAVTIGKLTEAYAKYSDEWTKLVIGKDGLYKGGIQGKKAGTSARGVVVPSADLRNGEIYIPHFFATTALCQEMLVTEDNLQHCQNLMNLRKVYQVKKVRGKQPGRKVQVITDNFADRTDHRLEVGDTIWRHAQTGDLTLLIRQPTQNKQNVIACTMIVGTDPKEYTIKVEMSVTTGMNMDFDGDTGSNATSQTPEAREDMLKMLISRNVRSAQKSEPMYGLVYHNILASALITLPGVEVSKSLWADCVSGIACMDSTRITEIDHRLAIRGIEKYSGKGLISMAFPPDFYYKKEKVVDKKGVVIEDEILVENGILVSGFLTGSIVGSASGGILDKMSIMYSGCGKSRGACTCEGGKCAENGWQIVSNFISDASYILTKFLDSFGFTVGYTDSFFGENINEKVTEAIEKLNNEVLALKKPVGYYEKLKYDKDVESLVNATKSISKDLGIFHRDISKVPLVDSQGLPRPNDEIMKEQVGNNLMFMSKLVSKAKGDESNLASIGVLLGQQYLLGNVLAKVITGNTRMLVTDRPNSSMLKQQGFIEHSYAHGLDPSEVFCGAHSNREGIASTQTNTPDIGVLQKSLDKLLENLESKNGAAVFKDTTIINFSYGGDSLNPEEILRVGPYSQALDVDSMIGSINAKYLLK